ncbi:type 4a pilus biogenesis protein PilO [Gilvimarinus sp. F26214L]|uniref:type 4a pilus biogenesis protein PilO n=1 Tax=Gilvimarinus sp. DZF01 TaxID=3461371 RepID=UPI004045809D
MALADTLEQIQSVDLSDVERIGVWPIAVRAGIWLAAIAVIFAGTYFLFIKDMNVRLLSAEKKEQQLRKNFESKALEAANLEELKAQMVAMEETFEGLVSQLPSDTEVPGLIEDIEEKGAAAGLNIYSTTFQQERAAEFYVELPIEIKVQGNSYHDLGGFVSGIAGMPRIVTLHNFQISPVGGSRGLNMTILAKTYRYKGQEK